MIVLDKLVNEYPIDKYKYKISRKRVFSGSKALNNYNIKGFFIDHCNNM